MSTSLTFELLQPDEAWPTDVEAFVHAHPNALIYHQPAYQRFLCSILQYATPRYWVLRQQHDVVGLIPSFACRNQGETIINSLPFYGSNGGILVDETRVSRAEKQQAYQHFMADAMQQQAGAATMVMSPYERDYALYDSLEHTHCDQRIGQITTLHNDTSTENLLARFHVKTRNAVRKGLKQGLVFEPTSATTSLDFLYQTHFENMQVIGGLPKPYVIFQTLTSIYRYPDDYIIWCAKTPAGEPVAAVLLLYCNRRVEYYTPVIKPEFRHTQCLSALIFTAMQDAIDKGYSAWNWGGTWATQHSVYRFKKRWGADDHVYCYYVKVFADSLYARPKEMLLQQFPYFYTYPFHQTMIETVDAD